MNIAKDIAETLCNLMAPVPSDAISDRQRIPRMAIHAGSMEAVITKKLEPVRDILMRAHNAESPRDMWEDISKALALFKDDS